MIRIINIISGHLIRSISLFVIITFPTLKLQYQGVKEIVGKSFCDIEKIPANLINSLIIIEDKRFYEHRGVDVYGVVRAITKILLKKKIEGASTIVQQLVRNITNERTIRISRKVKEIIFASLLDKDFPKEKILTAYFTTYQFYTRTGIFSFCKEENYLIDSLTENQFAEIAARFKYPIINKDNYILYLKRVRTIEIKLSSNQGYS